MKCEVCQQAEAETVVRVSIAGRESELFVCHDCLGKRMQDGRPRSGDAVMVETFWGGALVAAQEGDVPALAARDATPCPACGMVPHDFRKRIWLGCAACYDHFAATLAPFLRDMHVATRHIGKIPRAELAQAKREQIEAELATAVEEQRFEQAANLRDELMALNRRVVKTAKGSDV